MSRIRARGKGWKIRINRDVTGRDKGMWFKERNKGKNKEKCVNGAIIPDSVVNYLLFGQRRYHGCSGGAPRAEGSKPHYAGGS